MVSDYRKLDVWQKAHAMAQKANAVANSFRASQYASLRSQLIRAANSVPTNIVEGSGQESAREFCRFIRYSINSANETEYDCLAARDYGLIDSPDYEELTSHVTQVRRMLYGLLKYLRSKEEMKPKTK